MAIFLGGGGGRDESVELDREFARTIADGRLIYWPFAMAGERDLSECEAWLRETLEPLGVSDIDTWPDLTSRDLRELTRAAGLYIGGGNTYRLLDELQRADAMPVLAEVMPTLPIYGGSAGAAVLGATIETISHLDTNDVGITIFDAMDLLGGASVWVHHEAADRDRIETFLAQHHDRILYAIPIDGGLVVDSNRVTSFGFSASRVMGAVDMELEPGASTLL